MSEREDYADNDLSPPLEEKIVSLLTFGNLMFLVWLASLGLLVIALVFGWR